MVINLIENIEKPKDADLRHIQPELNVFVKEKDLGKGTLYIAQSR